MALDIDRWLYHGVQAGIISDQQSIIAKKIFKGQRVHETGVPGLMRLCDCTVVSPDDLATFRQHDMISVITQGDENVVLTRDAK